MQGELSRRRLGSPEEELKGPRREGPYAFIVGAPRSGTTWLQLLIGRHSDVATGQETHVFERYLAHMDRTWTRDRTERTERAIGLWPLLSDEEFYGLCRIFARGALEKLRQRADGSPRWIVEKTPGHVFSAELVLRLFPKAHFIHLIRDPRSVVASLRAASGSWGARWADAGVIHNTRMWRRSVEAGLRVRELTDRYHEIRYEALHADTAGELARIYSELGLPAETEHCRRAAEACRIGNLKGTAAGNGDAPWNLEEEPEGFFRKGAVDAWRTELSRSQIRVVERVAGDLLARSGYEPAAGGPGLSMRVGAEKLLDVLERGLRGAASVVNAGKRRL